MDTLKEMHGLWGLQYVVNKSRELAAKHNQDYNKSNKEDEREKQSSPSAEGGGRRDEGQTFLQVQHEQLQEVTENHLKLLESGKGLADDLAHVRRKLQAQAESEQFLSTHFDSLMQVREQLSDVRLFVEKLAQDAEEVEQILTQKTEEHLAAENAGFAAQQQEELEKFESHILQEQEQHKREQLEQRRQVLARAFECDLEAYKSLASNKKKSDHPTDDQAQSLDSIELVVAGDQTQLDAFYDTEDEDDLGEEVEEEKEEKDGI